MSENMSVPKIAELSQAGIPTKVSVHWAWHFSCWAMACCAFRLHGQRCVWATWWVSEEFCRFLECR